MLLIPLYSSSCLEDLTEADWQAAQEDLNVAEMKLFQEEVNQMQQRFREQLAVPPHITEWRGPGEYCEVLTEADWEASAPSLTTKPSLSKFDNIELCPISNELLHLCRDIKEHPFPELLAADNPFTVQKPSLFKNNVRIRRERIFNRKGTFRPSFEGPKQLYRYDMLPNAKAFSAWEWLGTIAEQIHRTTAKPEQHVYGMAQQQLRLWRSISSLASSHRSTFVVGFFAARIPVACAVSDTKYDPPAVRTRNPIFEYKSPYDFILLGLMVSYLALALYLRAGTRFHEMGFRVSYALTISMGALAFIVNRDDFAPAIRTTVLEIWFPAAVHVIVQYCYDNYNPTRHILSFFGLAIVPSLALIQFPTIGLLQILPPYVAIVALIAMAVHELVNPTPYQYYNRQDEEHGDQAFDLEDYATRVDQLAGTHIAEESCTAQSSERRVRHNSDQSRPSLSVSTIGDVIPSATSLYSGSPETPHQP